jgi:hypothetical protein
MISGALNASEDIIKDKWHISIFRNFERFKWFKYDSWKNKYTFEKNKIIDRVKWDFILFKINKPVQLTDWWHFSKMIRLIFMFSAIGIASTLSLNVNQAILLVIICGTLRNIIFSFFYNKLQLKR